MSFGYFPFHHLKRKMTSTNHCSVMSVTELWSRTLRKSSGSQYPAQHRAFLSSPLETSFIAKGIWWIILFTYASEKKTKAKITFYSYQSDGNRFHEAVCYWRNLVSGTKLFYRTSCKTLCFLKLEGLGLFLKGRLGLQLELPLHIDLRVSSALCGGPLLRAGDYLLLECLDRSEL